MEYLVLAVLGWSAVFILIPIERIKELIMAPVIAFIWIVIVNNISVILNYYRFTHTLIPIGYSPLFQSLAAAAVGLMMINWLTESPISKLVSSVLASAFLTGVRYAYVQLDAFKYLRFDTMLGFIHSLAAFSIFIWVAMAVIGEAKIYRGIKSRFYARKAVQR